MTRVAFWCLNVNVNSAVADVTAAGYGGNPSWSVFKWILLSAQCESMSILMDESVDIMFCPEICQ